MSTVVEIEAAIEKLPHSQQRELAEWMEDLQILHESSDALFQMLDEEEEKAGIKP